MPVLLTGRGFVVCLAITASACASSEAERTAAAPAGSQTAALSPCDSIARFTRISFIAADRNNDGVVDEAEYASDAAGAFAGEDRNHDYQLSRSELPDAPPGTFDRIDSDRSGTISFKELMQMKLDEFQRADTNKDGVLSVVEVTRFNAGQGGC
jgi:hypothetical protein